MSSWRGHLVAGVIAFAVYVWAITTYGFITIELTDRTMGLFLLGGLLALIGGMFPDVDTRTSIIGSFFEKLFFLGILAAVGYILLFVSLPLEWKLGLAGVLVVLGYLFYTDIIDEHRTHAIYGLHALKAAAAISFGLFWALSLLNTSELDRALLAGAFLIGYLSHLALDGELLHI